MPTRGDGFPARPLVTALVLVCSAMIGLAAASARTASEANGPAVHSAASPPAPTSPAQTTGIVGDETCATCHETASRGLHQTLHGKTQNTRTPAAKTGQACETCHGPGQAHVDSGKKEDIRRFATLKARNANMPVFVPRQGCGPCALAGRACTTRATCRA